MSRRRASPAALLLLLVLLPAAAAALDLFVRQPRPGQPAFGVVTVEVEVLSASAVTRVEVFLDGVLAATASRPPWVFEVDAGLENREKLFEIVARNAAGEEARRHHRAPPLAVDGELDLGLQQLYVTVSRAGARVLDLEREAFRVLDDGEPQEIVTFERGDVPLAAVLLVDSSWSMRGGALDAAIAGARAFVADMRPLDRAKVVLFSDRVVAETPFTGEAAAVGEALSAARGSGGTAINDHLYLALQHLGDEQGRAVVVLLSDGIDVESVLEMSDVRWKAARSRALIYWIRLGTARRLDATHYSAWRGPDGHRREIAGLEEAVAESGGRIVDIEQAAAAGAAFGEILAELREQYVFGYYPSADRDDGAWHRVKVLARGAGVRVRTRAGYFDGTPTAAAEAGALRRSAPAAGAGPGRRPRRP